MHTCRMMAQWKCSAETPSHVSGMLMSAFDAILKKFDTGWPRMCSSICMQQCCHSGLRRSISRLRLWTRWHFGWPRCSTNRGLIMSHQANITTSTTLWVVCCGGTINQNMHRLYYAAHSCWYWWKHSELEHPGDCQRSHSSCRAHETHRGRCDTIIGWIPSCRGFCLGTIWSNDSVG